METTVEETLKAMPGAFANSLTRSNKEIKADRALSISESARKIYRRQIEDLNDSISDMKRQLENSLDLSGNDKNTILNAASFDAAKFVSNDIELALQIVLKEKKVEIAVLRYRYLFGETLNLS